MTFGYKRLSEPSFIYEYESTILYNTKTVNTCIHYLYNNIIIMWSCSGNILAYYLDKTTLISLSY